MIQCNPLGIKTFLLKKIINEDVMVNNVIIGLLENLLVTRIVRQQIQIANRLRAAAQEAVTEGEMLLAASMGFAASSSLLTRQNCVLRRPVEDWAREKVDFD